MIEVDDVVVKELGAGDQVPDEAGVLRDDNPEGVLDGADGGKGVDRGTNATGALGEHPRITRIAFPQDHLKPAEHGAGLDVFGRPCQR